MAHEFDHLVGGARPRPRAAGWPLLAAAVPVGDLPPSSFPRLSPPQYQATASSCGPHGAYGALESDVLHRKGALIAGCRQDLYFGARWLEFNGAETRDAGSFPDKWAEWLRTYGTVSEILRPYDPKIVTTWRPPASWAADRKLLTADLQPMQRSVDQVRAELAAGRTVVICHFVYRQMTEEARTTGQEHEPSPNPANSKGGHCRVVAGYDDALGKFLVWNWWRGWGIAHPKADSDLAFRHHRDSFSWVPYQLLVDPNWGFSWQRIARGFEVEV